MSAVSARPNHHTRAEGHLVERQRPDRRSTRDLRRERQVAVLGVVDTRGVPSGGREHSRQHARVEELVGPEFAVVATRERGAADRMEDGQAALRARDAGERSEEINRIGYVRHESGGEDRIHAIGRDGKTRCVREHQPGTGGSPAIGRGAQHLRRGINSDDESVIAYGVLQERECSTATAAEIDHDVARRELHAGDRLGIRRYVVGEALVPARRARPEELARPFQI